MLSDKARRLKLKPTDVAGIYINRAGVHVDEDGVAVTFKALRQHDEAAMAEVSGEVPKTPAEFLRTVVFDPRHNKAVRIDAAKACAQYFTPKLNAIQGGPAGAPPVEIVDVGAMTTGQLKAYRAALAAALSAATKK